MGLLIPGSWVQAPHRALFCPFIHSIFHDRAQVVHLTGKVSSCVSVYINIVPLHVLTQHMCAQLILRTDIWIGWRCHSNNDCHHLGIEVCVHHISCTSVSVLICSASAQCTYLTVAQCTYVYNTIYKRSVIGYCNSSLVKFVCACVQCHVLYYIL